MQFSIEQFLSVRTAYSPSFSPDGKSMIYLTDATGLAQVWKVDLADPAPKQVTFLNDRVALAQYSPVDRQFIASMDSGGDENMQLFLVNDTGEPCEALTKNPAAMHVFGGWSPDGKQIVFSANIRHRAYFDFYVMDLATRTSRMVYENNVLGHPFVFWLGDHAIIAGIVESSSKQIILRIDVSSGQVRKVLDTDSESSLGAIKPDPRNNRLYITTYLNRDFHGLAMLDLSGKIELVKTPAWDVEAMALTADARTLAYSVNADGYSELHLMDTTTGAELEVPKMPRGVIGVAGVVQDGGLLFSPDGNHLAITFSSANRNRDVWILDVRKKAISRLTHSSTAGIPSDVLREPELIRYRTFDGRLIPAFVIKPDVAPGKRSPAIVWVHGGPESQSRPEWRAEVQYFASLGYAIFVPNVRGSGGYGREYLHLDDVRKRMDSVKDLASGVEWLKGQSWVDPDKVAVQGGSYGGFMVLSSITTYPELFAAAIDFFGIGNFETFLLNTSSYRRKHREAEYGSLENDLEFLREISPAHHVDKIRCPILVIQGRKDPRVPFSESEQMVGRISAQGGIAESIYFDDEGHGIVRPQNKIASWGGMADFLERRMLKK